jgi:hypothetical protein
MQQVGMHAVLMVDMSDSAAVVDVALYMHLHQ